MMTAIFGISFLDSAREEASMGILSQLVAYFLIVHGPAMLPYRLSLLMSR